MDTTKMILFFFQHCTYLGCARSLLLCIGAQALGEGFSASGTLTQWL